MTCERCKDNLTDLIEGDLSPDTARELEAHIAACPDCARVLSEMRALVAVLQGLPELSPPSGLRERLRDIPQSAGAGYAGWWRQSRRAVSMFAAAAAAVLLIGAGVHFYPGESGQLMTPMAPEPMARLSGEMVAGQRDAEDVAETLSEAPENDGADMAAERPEDASVEARAEASEPAPPIRRAPVTVPKADTPSPRPAAAIRERSQPRTESTAPRVADAESSLMQSLALAEDEAGVDAEKSTPMRASRSVAPDPDHAARPGAPALSRSVAPGGRSPVAGAEASAYSRDTLILPGPMYLDAGEGTASARVGEGTPFSVGVTPPHEKVVGTVVAATIRLGTEADVACARITVAGSDDLELIGVDEDGLVFEGPLTAGQQTVLSVRMLAREPGSQSITMRLRSTDPIVDTQLDVRMGDFSRPIPPAERPVKFNFVGTPIREAVSEVTRQSGLNVIVDPGVGEATVTARADDPLPAAGALRAIAESAGLTVTEKDGRCVVEKANDNQ